MSRQALGKGLKSLIPQADFVGRSQVTQVGVGDIEPNPFQPRKKFDNEKLEKLADSIRKHGILEPIIVRRSEDGYQIVVGERRWRASSLAGIDKLPAVVKEISDKQMTEIALIENLQREDLNAVEEAEGYRILIEQFGLTQEDVAQSVGKKRSSIANALRLLTLEREVRQLVADGKLSRGHAKVLLSLADSKQQVQIAHKVVKQQLSVRQLERMINQRPKRSHIKQRRINPEVKALQEEMQRVLGTRVRLDYNNGKGKIEIEYYSDAELERIFEFMRS